MQYIPINTIVSVLEVRDLSPYGLNILRKSMRDRTFLVNYPITVSKVADGQYEIIDGNHRYTVAREMGIDQLPCCIVDNLPKEEQFKLAIQSNQAAEVVVKSTLVTYAKFVWARRNEGYKQSQIASMLGWNGSGQVRVAQYEALQKIGQPAWKEIITTFETPVIEDDEGDVIPDITPVTSPFTENLLRSILDLRAPQQLDLVSRLATGDINKNKFKSQAEAYSTRNAIKRYVMQELRTLDHSWWKSAFKEIEKGAYDQDWKVDGKPKISKLIAAIREEYEQKEGIRLLHGDFNVEVLSIADGSIDLIVTDPPYGISEYSGVTKVGNQLVAANFDGDDGHQWDTVDPELFQAQLDAWVTQWARILRPGGALVAFTDKALISDLWRICKAHGLLPKNTIVWVKTNPHPASLARRNLKSASEFMIWAVKPGAEYTFNTPQSWDLSNVIVAPLCGGAERLKDAKGTTLHPTQKPEAVLQPLVEAFSNRGDVVFDGFAGVGSTGKAARSLARKFIGIEQSMPFFEAMQRRLA